MNEVQYGMQAYQILATRNICQKGKRKSTFGTHAFLPVELALTGNTDANNRNHEKPSHWKLSLHQIQPIKFLKLQPLTQSLFACPAFAILTKMTCKNHCLWSFFNVVQGRKDS